MNKETTDANGASLATANAKFLAHIYRNGHWAHLWTDAGKISSWFGVNGNSESEPMLEPNNKHNVYMSVHPCAAIPPKNSSGNTNKQYIKVQDDYIECINHLYAEFDGKDYVAESEYQEFLPDDFDSLSGARKKALIQKAKESAFYASAAEFKQRALDAIELVSPPASVIIDSGGGYHCYWFLSQSVILNESNRDDIKRVQAGWVGRVGGDSGAKDLARILRLAGTYNCKKGFGKNRPMVSYIKTDFDLLYSYAELAQLVQQSAEKTQPTTAPEQPTTAVVQQRSDNPHVIDAFNERYTVDEMLLKHGYTESNGRWSRPDQPDSGGVSVMANGKSYHYSSNDPLDSDHSAKNQPRSAFDFELEFTYHGDYKAAVRALAPEFGLDYQSRIDTLVQSIRTVDRETGEVLELDVTAENIVDIISDIGSSDVDNKIATVRNELALAVGTIESSAHVEIESALVEHIKMSRTDAKNFTAACRRDAKSRKKAAAQQRTAEISERRISDRGERPAIQINNVQDRDILSKVKDAIVASNAKSPSQPMLYTSGGRLSRVVSISGEDQIGSIGRASQLDNTLFDVADYISVGSDADGNPKEVDASLPPRISQAYLGRGYYPELPEIRGTIYAPSVTPDGTIHTEPAYNATTKLYYSNPVEIGAMMPVGDAVNYIDTECFSDFPFKDAASKAHSFECMLLPFVREAINGPTPLHTFDSAVAGTGKSKLAKVCLIPAVGRIAAAENEPARNEDWGKELTATLVKGKPYVFLDNIKRNVDSGALASCLTETEREDRRFGTNDEALRYSIRQTWIMTGNNLHLDYEIARRSIWIRIESEHEKPHERDISNFRHANLTRWALENRPKLVTACLSIVQHWIDEGMPRFTEKAKGSYEEWSEIMGGILQAAGIDGFLENEQQLIENAVDEVETWNEFVTVWLERYGESDTATKDLFKIASHSDTATIDGSEYLDILAEELGAGKEQSRKIRLGRKLKEMRGRVIAGYRIERGPTVMGSPQWRLESLNKAKNGTLIL